MWVCLSSKSSFFSFFCLSLSVSLSLLQLDLKAGFDCEELSSERKREKEMRRMRDRAGSAGPRGLLLLLLV